MHILDLLNFIKKKFGGVNEINVYIINSEYIISLLEKSEGRISHAPREYIWICCLELNKFINRKHQILQLGGNQPNANLMLDLSLLEKQNIKRWPTEGSRPLKNLLPFGHFPKVTLTSPPPSGLEIHEVLFAREVLKQHYLKSFKSTSNPKNLVLETNKAKQLH